MSTKPRTRTLSCVAAVLAQAAVVLAESPDFSGTWRLDPDRSRVEQEAGLSGLIGAGVPEILHVTHPANGTLVVESQINESHARIYTPGGETSTPIFLGEPGSITMTSRWGGRKLVSEGRREFSPGTPAVEVKETFGLGADGGTLEIEITTRSPDGESASTLTYTRIGDIAPCESWPTPCKTPSR